MVALWVTDVMLAVSTVIFTSTFCGFSLLTWKLSSDDVDGWMDGWMDGVHDAPVCLEDDVLTCRIVQ